MNLEFDLLVNLTVALSLGALIGAEREVTEIGKKQREEGIEFSGLRTYTLISLLGFLAACVSNQWGGFLVGIFFAVVGIFLLVEYWQQSHHRHFTGITSELAALATFAVGAIAFTSPLDR